MKPSLQLSIGQHLTLTPQLQQAIRLLQLSTIDLQQEIQQAVESNPMLESSPPEEDREDLKTQNNAADSDTDQEPTDFQWSDRTGSSSKTTPFDGEDYNYENYHAATTTLRDHLHWQLELTPMGDIDRLIAIAVLDAINEDGFLTISIDDLHGSLNKSNPPIEKAEIEAVRHRIQRFDPLGCGSLTLREALLVQLEQLPEATPLLQLTRTIVKEDIDLLGTHNYRQLMKKHRIDEKTTQQVVRMIQHLQPKPGALITTVPTEYVIPDLSVKKINGNWEVVLNHNVLPKLSINAQYASLIQRADNSAENQYLKNNLQEARWFLKSIQSRQDTLHKVATCIVAHQQGFLEHGEEAMRPLILNDIATALEMHESTISRVTTQKFMHTPRGMFELKYFFSSHVRTNAGGECSSTAIRAVIKKLIAAENRSKPLSDSKIALLIGRQGIQIARRTVAKYREALGLAPSNERKTKLV